MAQLKDTIIQGSAKITDTLYSEKIQITKINIPTSAGGTTYGPGTAGYALLSNGDNGVYWGNVAITETDPTVPAWAKASSKPSYSLSEITSATNVKAIENLTGTSGLLKKTAANTWALDTTTYISAASAVGSANQMLISSSTSVYWGNMIVGKGDVDNSLIMCPTVTNAEKNQATTGSSVALGSRSIASGMGSFAMGVKIASQTSGNQAMGSGSVAMGGSSIASGSYSLAIGQAPQATGGVSVALNSKTIASGSRAFATGEQTIASGPASSSFGCFTEASGRHSMAIGTYNIVDDYSGTEYAAIHGEGTKKYIFTIGNGTSATRSNAMTVDWDGNTAIAGSLMVGSSSYGDTLPATGTQGQIFFKKLS